MSCSMYYHRARGRVWQQPMLGSQPRAGRQDHRDAGLCLTPSPYSSPAEPPSKSNHIPTPRSSPPRRSHQTGLKVNNSLPRPGAGSRRDRPRWGAWGGRGRQAEPRKQHGARRAAPAAHTDGDRPLAPPPSKVHSFIATSPSFRVLSSTSHAGSSLRIPTVRAVMPGVFAGYPGAL